MNGLVWIAVALGVLWLLGVTVFKIVSFAIHLALIAALVLFAIWAFQKVTGAAHRARSS
jgi:uncharacterized membrane protein